MRLQTTSPRKTHLVHILVASLAILAAGCGSAADTSSADTSDASTSDSEAEETKGQPDRSDSSTEEKLAQSASGDYPEVTGVEAQASADGTWTIDVTVSSSYDTPERYADAWRVQDQQGNELALRELDHDHANEQPFTREVSGVVIPEGVESITVEGRDSVNGWGGQTFTYSLPDASQY